MDQTSNRLPSLDGWRAVSIILVLIQHSTVKPGWPIVFNFSILRSVGGVGVRFFFVISGFLITWLLIKEAAKYHNNSIKSFYVKRCIRILPVLFSYLIVVSLLQFFVGFIFNTKEYLIAGTFMADLWMTDLPFAHLWSLGVEEKFYLFWPVIFVLFFEMNMQKLTVILIILIVTCPLLRGLVVFYKLDGQHEFFNYHSFLVIYDGLAIGCLGAILFVKYPIIVYSICKKSNFLLFFVGGVLIMLPAVFWIVPLLSNLKPFQDTLQCSGFLILMIQSIANPSFFVYKILNFTPVKHIGVISYSLYIWMGIAELDPERYGLSSHFFNRFPAWLIVTILLAELSYILIELPIIKMRKLLL